MTLSPNTVKQYRKISELDPLISPLTGSEIIPVVIAGKTFKRQWSEMFGDGWFEKLRSGLAAFISPNATHADQTDYAALAADSEAANGISFADGHGLDRWEEIEIPAGAAWVIPSGSFQIYAWNADSIPSLTIEADDGRIPGSFSLRAPFPSGSVLSDGVSLRVRNRSAGKIGLTYRVMAHK